jgi:hypothetical protein
LRAAEAWEIEASLIYDEFAWFLCQELWDISLGVRPELTADERAITESLSPIRLAREYQRHRQHRSL